MRRQRILGSAILAPAGALLCPRGRPSAQAQGLWRRLHGQDPNPGAGNKSKELREREAAEADAEWAGAGAEPGQQRFTLVGPGF